MIIVLTVLFGPQWIEIDPSSLQVRSNFPLLLQPIGKGEVCDSNVNILHGCNKSLEMSSYSDIFNLQGILVNLGDLKHINSYLPTLFAKVFKYLFTLYFDKIEQ
jgi:hypothetical protein